MGVGGVNGGDLKWGKHDVGDARGGGGDRTAHGLVEGSGCVG